MRSMRDLMNAVLSEGVIDPTLRKFHRSERFTPKEKSRMVAVAESELRAARSEMVSRKLSMEMLGEGPERVKAEEDYLVSKSDYKKAKDKKKDADDADVLTDKEVKEAASAVSYVRRMVKDRTKPNPRKLTVTEASERLSRRIPDATVRQPTSFDLCFDDLLEDSARMEEPTEGGDEPAQRLDYAESEQEVGDGEPVEEAPEEVADADDEADEILSKQGPSLPTTDSKPMQSGTPFYGAIRG